MTSAAFITFISAIDASKQRQKAEKERMEQQRQQQRRQLTRHSMDVSAGRAAGNGPAHNHHGLHRNSSSRHGHAHAHGPSNSRAAAPSDKILRPLRRQSSSISSTHTAAAAGAGQHHDSSVASAQGCEHISGSPPDTAAVQANVTAPAPAP